MTNWQMWAGRREGQEEFSDVGQFRYTRAMGHRTPVQVIVTENEAGPYWGWLDKDRVTPTMIYRREPLFRVCFPYRPEEEEAAGRGRIVRLDIELAP